MNIRHFTLGFALSGAALALAACGKSAETAAPEAPAAAQSLMQEAQALPAEEQPVFAWRQLTAYQQAHPEAQPACDSIRRVDAIGVIPENVAPDSIYAAHKGALAFTVQCGPQLTTVQDDPKQHWLVALAPAAGEAAVAVCAGENNRDLCPRIPPRAAIEP